MLLFSPNTLSSRLLFKNLIIKMHKTIILPVVLYGLSYMVILSLED